MTSVGDAAEVAQAREENARLRRELEALLHSQDTAKDRARVLSAHKSPSFFVWMGGGSEWRTYNGEYLTDSDRESCVGEQEASY
jgi:cell shape-determining protein MreC